MCPGRRHRHRQPRLERRRARWGEQQAAGAVAADAPHAHPLAGLVADPRIDTRHRIVAAVPRAPAFPGSSAVPDPRAPLRCRPAPAPCSAPPPAFCASSCSTPGYRSCRSRLLLVLVPARPYGAPCVGRSSVCCFQRCSDAFGNGRRPLFSAPWPPRPRGAVCAWRRGGRAAAFGSLRHLSAPSAGCAPKFRAAWSLLPTPIWVAPPGRVGCSCSSSGSTFLVCRKRTGRLPLLVAAVPARPGLQRSRLGPVPGGARPRTQVALSRLVCCSQFFSADGAYRRPRVGRRLARSARVPRRRRC